VVPYFEFRIYFLTCFAKLVLGSNLNMKKKLVSSFAKTENPEKKSFRIALFATRWGRAECWYLAAELDML